MKKSFVIFLIINMLVLTSVFSILGQAATCDLNAKLLNQDPFPAIPGESVWLVFQIDGVDNPNCGKVDFTLIESYPLTIEEGTSAITSINSGVFVRNFGNFFLAPYTVIIDEDALDGQNEIEAFLDAQNSPSKIVDFEITVEDSRADFEVSIRDYVESTREITFEILNIAERDIESLTIEIAKQDNILIKGTNRNIVGSLDANEDTTFSFEGTPTDGDINLDIFYTDKIGVRRNIQKTVNYDSSYFVNRARDQNGNGSGVYWVVGIVVVLLIWWFLRIRKKKHDVHHAKHGHRGASHHKKH